MKQLSAAYISELRTRKIDIYTTIIIAFAIGLATLTPVEKLPTVSGSDKVYHLISFAILTLPIAIIRPRAIWIILSLSIAYGGAIELLQPLVNRNCEMADFLADAFGAILGVLVTRALRARPGPTAD
ncbi:VanZ family protein [Paracoccaceae bacterium]|jgi:VanZ family protein|nr:VanZ family protein [Paracoccaceae bacterium]|tara:strand:+ start:519 stop:899 length:381 start_codon:yes stop_codon:yes gene_type:complete